MRFAGWYGEFAPWRKWSLIAACLCLCSMGAAPGHAGELREIDEAIKRGLAIVQKGAKNYPSHRQCFSCHHQTLPLLAMREAEEAGYEIDDEAVKAIQDHTFKSFHSRIDKLRDGRRIGGRANTVSYGLWAFDLTEHVPDETTQAMIEFLLKNQREDGRWVPPSNRPPLEESQISVTFLSAYYMSQFTGQQQQQKVEQSVTQARKWLSSADPESQEDLSFQLWGLQLLEEDEAEERKTRQKELRDEIISLQRDDGGWSQLPKMESDAYATGQTLFILLDCGLPEDSDVAYRAIEYLHQTQLDDGSWLVETRAKPVQVFFDNGDPHGKSQFISVAGTSWAVAALARAKRLSEK